MTVKDIIQSTPYTPHGTDMVYNGSKNTTTYSINARTGARKEGMRGKLQQADGGTLFLDEIGDMPKLLSPPPLTTSRSARR